MVLGGPNLPQPPALRFRERVAALGGLRIDEILFHDAEGCRRSLQQVKAFADETPQLTETDLAAVESQVARGFVAHARMHLSRLLREDRDAALRLLDEFDRAPRLDTLPALLDAIEGINFAQRNPVESLRTSLTAAFAAQPEVAQRLALLAGRWLTGGMPRHRPAGSAVLVGAYGSGRSRVVEGFLKVLQAQGLAGEETHEEIDLRAYATSDNGPQRLVERLASMSQRSGRRVYAFDAVDLAPPAVKDVLQSLAATGSANAGGNAASLDGRFLFFMIARDPAGTLGNAFLNEVQEVITLSAPTAAQVEEMVAAEMARFAGDFAVHAGVRLEIDAAVSASLVPRVIERGGFGHSVPAIVEERLRLPVADLRTQGVMRDGSARLVVEDGALVLVQGRERMVLPERGRGAIAAAPLDLEAEIAKLVGLEPVKVMLRALRKQLVADQRRRDAGLAQRTGQTRHMLFLGNPGTGKTTVARLVARMLRGLGVLREGQLVEVTRADLVASYVGQTAPKTLEVVQRALGGVLFIDEAYALTRGDDPFGKEAVDTLVREIEDRRDDLVVILAGYSKEMGEFLQSNSGLASRFPHRFEFPDYTAAELARIALIEAKGRGFAVDDGVEARLAEHFEGKVVAGRNDQGNGRLARTVVEAAIGRQSGRVADQPGLAPEAMQRLLAEDFGVGADDAAREAGASRDALAALDDIVGLEAIKEFVRDLAAEIKATERRRALGLPADASRSLHMVFKGNPGTGKTTVARIVGRLLKELKVLKMGHVVEVDRAGLVAGYVGQTALKTQEKIREALGGLLFVDEAYALADAGGGQGSFGREALDTLVKGMEDHRDSLVVVLAGYSGDMERLLDVNAGLRSRFPNVIEFADYSPAELLQIAERMLAVRGLVASPEALARIRAACAAAAGDPAAGNGRFVRNLLEAAVRRQSRRLLDVAEPTRDDLVALEAIDIPEVSCRLT
jgi:SpoVK/Ycf46/Vps4 family AAA+-type ATPase